MRSHLSLAVAAALTLASFAASPALAANCQTKHSGACSNPGASCGPRAENGYCETVTRRSYRASKTICACHPRHYSH
jgi:hypothetical protein